MLLFLIRQSRLRYARTSGVQAGLTVLLDAELDDYNVTSSSINGFKVYQLSILLANSACCLKCYLCYPRSRFKTQWTFLRPQGKVSLQARDSKLMLLSPVTPREQTTSLESLISRKGYAPPVKKLPSNTFKTTPDHIASSIA